MTFFMFFVFSVSVFATESVVEKQIQNLIARADANARDIHRLQLEDDPDAQEIAMIANRGAHMSEEMFTINEQNPVMTIREKYLVQELRRKMEATLEVINGLRKQITKGKNRKKQTQKPRRALRAVFFCIKSNFVV